MLNQNKGVKMSKTKQWIDNMLSGSDNPRTSEDEKYLKSLDEKWIAEQKKKLNAKK